MASGQKPFYIAIGLVIVAGGIFIGMKMRSTSFVSIPANVVVTAADTSGFRGYVLGSPTAPVEVTEYADFECPICADFDAVSFPDMKLRLIDPGKMRLRFREFPLDGPHHFPRIAAHAAACANDQGKFWEAKEAIFRSQTEWSTSTNPMPGLSDAIKSAGVDPSTWRTCMQSKKYAGRIQASLDEGTRLGVNSTPSFLINGRIYPGKVSIDSLVRIVDSLGAAAPAPAPAGKPTISGGQ